MIQTETYPTLSLSHAMYTYFVQSTLRSQLPPSGEKEDLSGRSEVYIRWGCQGGEGRAMGKEGIRAFSLV